MARVVQRTSPPYLTVLFVFLFFIAAAAAAWFYNGWRGTNKQLEAKTESLADIASGIEQTDEAMAAQKARAREQGNRTAVGQYRADQEALLTALAAPEDVDVPTALATIGEMIGDNTSLLAEMARLKSDLRSLQQQKEALETQLAEAKALLASERETAEQQRVAMEQQREQLGEQMAALQQRVAELSEGYDSQIERARDEWSSRVTEQEQMLTAKEDEIRELEKSLREKDIRITQLQARLDVQAPDLEADIDADGRIVKVVDDKVVYIDLGRDDRLQIGLPFSVYAKQTGVGAEVPVKAKIIVRNVFDDIAECRVLEAEATDPINEGDLVSNIAFNVGASPTFVVEGDFDLDADGQLDRQGAERVAAMIRRYGGVVVDALDVNVDYVVMGETPVRTPRPGADAPPSDVALWEQNQKQAQRYHTVKAEAIKLSKPVLNTRRFLKFIGYAPEVAAAK